MTVAEYWDARAEDGRAVLLCLDRGPLLWLVRLRDTFVRVDDSVSGHILEVAPETETRELVRAWRIRHGAYP